MKCSLCGRTMVEGGESPMCPKGCNIIDVRSSLRAQRFDPVVYFVDKSGNKRFPGNTSQPPPKGFERRELTTVHEVRKFEKEMNRSERERWDRHKVREELTFGPMKQQSRSELVNMMQSFSNLGKDFAREAMKRNDEKRRGEYDAGFRIDAFS